MMASTILDEGGTVLVEVGLVVVWAWVWVAVAALVHEIGHARVAARYSSDVWLQWGGGRSVRLLGGPIARLLKYVAGIVSVDVWRGELWRSGSCVGHAGLNDRGRNLSLFRGGYRANFFVGAITLALTLVLTCFVGFPISSWDSSLLEWGLVVAPPTTNFAVAIFNCFKKKDWSEHPPYGSDAWNIGQLKKDRSFTPHASMTASQMRIANGVSVLTEDR